VKITIKTIYLLLVLILAGCQSRSEFKSTKDNSDLTSNPISIRIAVLPLIDTLPIYVADKEGLFIESGVIVDFIPVSSAPERDQLLAAGQADATVNEILSDMFFNKDSIQMIVVRYAQMASKDSAHFYILASEKSKIVNVNELVDVPIGISEGTIIEYVTDKLLMNAGLSNSEIIKVSIPKMPDRMALLASGELSAGVLPDPLASLAIQQGANVILDDRNFPSYGASVFSFTSQFVDQYPEVITKFLAAIEEATTLVNSNPEKYTELLSDKQLVPTSLIGNYAIPKFPQAGITSEVEWNDALSWAKEKGLINSDISYSDSVRPDFLP
jgi:NitT/TauT family transport system substrate-binding protein